MLLLPHQFCLFKSNLLSTRIKNKIKNKQTNKHTKHKTPKQLICKWTKQRQQQTINKEKIIKTNQTKNIFVGSNAQRMIEHTILNINRIISTPGWFIRIETCSHVCDGFNILMVDVHRRLITELYKIYYNT